MIVIAACAAIALVLGARITARASGVLDLGGEKGGDYMYVLRVYRGAVCFWKNTYFDWASAVMEFANYKDGFYTHIVLEVICERFSETWVKLCPCPKLEEGGENNE